MGVATLKCEYIWLDGTTPTQSLRSKTKVVTVNSEEEEWSLKVTDLPVWGFDGSSTGQATIKQSDCVLVPVFASVDPNRPNGVLVLCEVLDSDMNPHPTNSRSKLISSMRKCIDEQPAVGFEQEYFFMKNERPLGWPEEGVPAEQGPYYCAVGDSNVVGRDIAENHLSSCIGAGLSIGGINAEVALGQWEFQVGGPDVNAVTACDHLVVARYLLSRVAEVASVGVNLDPKPVSGDWNGSGLHANFSTKSMREEGGMEHITNACNALGSDSAIHDAVSNYGDGLERRLTGTHETSKINNFTFGVSDRSASVRIPLHVSRAGFGYFEDRRPNSNADPYMVTKTIVDAVCFQNEG